VRPLFVWLATLAFVLALEAVPAAAAPAAAAPSCGTASAGPGALRQAGDQGAECLLRAYADHCAPASFRLSVFGVDTIARDLFSLRARGSGCVVDVVVSFEVVPRPPTPHAGVCSALRRVGSAIEALGCSGKDIPGELSLTGLG
jgi:hypothetical protein